MDDDNNISVNDTMQDAGQQRRQQEQQESNTKKQIRKKAVDESKKLAKEGIKKGKATLFKSVTASLGTAIFGALIVVFMLIGIIAFILTMPGMVRDKIFNTVSGALEDLMDEVHGGSDHIINSDNIVTGTIEALNNLNELGLDPVGLGFVQNVFRDGNGNISGFNEGNESYVNSLKIDKSATNYTANNLIVSKIPSACPLLGYVLSNERTYLPKNYYIKADGTYSLKDSLIWEESAETFFEKMTSFDEIYQAIAGIKYVNRDDGMLDYNAKEVENLSSSIEINREDRTMTYTNRRLENGTILDQKSTIDLESWVGRYGTPLELLMALHIATMTSDVTSEMITNDDLKTDVKISFEDGVYDVDFKIQMKDDDGNKTELPILFGSEEKAGDLISLLKKYQPVSVQYNDETKKYEYTYESPSEPGEDYKKEAVTIRSLKSLIEEYKMIIPTIENVKEDYENGDEALDTGVGELLYGDNDIYLKYDVNLNEYSETFSQMGAYLGTYNEEEGVGTGFLSNDGTFSYSFADKVNGISWNYNGGESTYGIVNDAYNRPAQMNIDVSSDADSQLSRSFVKVPSFKNAMESVVSLNKNTETRDAMTCFMLEIDHYLWDRSAEYGEDDMITVDWDDSTYQLNIDYGAEQPYTINFSNYNYLITTDQSEQQLPGKITKLWIQSISDGIDWDDINNITNEIKKYYDPIHEIDENIKVVLDGIWCDIVDPDAEECPLTEDDINTIYNILVDYTKNATTMKMAYPRIESVTHHWFKDLDFSEAYGSSSETIELSAYESEDGRISATAYLSNNQHSAQTSQPFVIKGNIVTLDGEEVGTVEDKYGTNSNEFGKGYEASKKILTGGYYYVYDGTEATSNGILYNKLLENVKPGNMVEVRVSELGSILFIKALKNNGGVFIDETDNNKEIANIKDGILGWYVTGEEKAVTKSKCRVLHFKDVEKKNDEGEVTGTNHFYYVYIPESMQYISAAEDETEAKQTAEKINDLLLALGVNQSRIPVSFDNKNSNGDVAALTAFSILEGMKTETAQTIYRDFKEFLIELGYYTKAEFEYLNNNVLTWFIPDYIPEDPQHWQQNKNEDALLYGAVLYPATDDEDSEEKTKGFEPDLDVIAPGNARILEYKIDGENSYITLEFDGTSQPEIGMLDKYTMTIKGIQILTSLVEPSDTKTSDDEETEGTSIDTIVAEKTVIKAGTVIGKTGTTKIQVILKNANGAILNNVEDYMSPLSSILATSEIELSNDYNVFIDCNENVVRDVNQFKELFSEYPNIADNAEAFMEMQETYKVNAIFAAAVCINESSAGTNGNLVGKGSSNRNSTGYPYNMFSITYWGENALSHKVFNWTNSAASNWMAYDSFEQAILDFGNYIANSSHYFKSNKYKISEIAASYCPPGDDWASKVSNTMTEKLIQLLEGN